MTGSIIQYGYGTNTAISRAVLSGAKLLSKFLRQKFINNNGGFVMRIKGMNRTLIIKLSNFKKSKPIKRFDMCVCVCVYIYIYEFHTKLQPKK
jgi:hypothetical protein